MHNAFFRTTGIRAKALIHLSSTVLISGLLGDLYKISEFNSQLSGKEDSPIVHIYIYIIDIL